MRHYLTYTLACLAIATGMAVAQPTEKCGKRAMHLQRVAEDPSLLQRQAITEAEVAAWVAKHPDAGKEQTQKGTQSTYVIPIVFHIVHNNGAENVSDAKVLQTLKIMNDDYNQRAADLTQVETMFKPIIGNMSIEFRLATKDPAGNCTNGIVRTVSTLTSSANDNVKTVSPTWDPTRYVNIWVVKAINVGGGGGGGTVVGYSYLPNTVAQNVEGLVLDYNSIGTSAVALALDRTASHEMGHYLGLEHTFGNGACGDQANCSGTDNVADTPVTIGKLGGCPLPFSSCSNTRANIQNIMDYADCEINFTQGQVTRVLGYLNSATSNRKNHWQQANLVSTGTTQPTPTTLGSCPPAVAFASTSTVYGCPGTAIPLSAIVTNLATTTGVTFRWNVPGAVVPTATGISPSFTFAAPGAYSATVIATNSTGSDTATSTGFIQIFPTTAAYTAPYLEDFSSAVLPTASTNLGSGWRLQSSSTTITTNWVVNSSISFKTPKSMSINNRIQTGVLSTAISPTVDVTSLTSSVQPKRLQYEYAYMPRSASSADELKVYLSNNCGNTWTNVVTRNNTSTPSLNTVGGFTTGAFLPDTTQWKTETVQIPAAMTNASQLMMKFEMKAGGGNPTYIDNVRFVGDPTALPVFIGTTTQVVPNPAFAGQVATLSCLANADGQAQVMVMDAVGHVLMNQTTHLTAGANSVELGQFAAGIYTVVMRQGGAQTTRKLVVQ